jgi:hypothetical protein
MVVVRFLWKERALTDGLVKYSFDYQIARIVYIVEESGNLDLLATQRIKCRSTPEESSLFFECRSSVP